MNNIIRINTISEVHKFFGLNKPKHPLVSFQKHENINFSIISKDTKIVLNLYHIMLKKGFSGSFSYGKNSYDFQEGKMVFTSPEQVVQSSDSHNSERATGWSMLFHPDLIRKSDLGNTIDKYSFFGYDIYEALHLSEDEINTISDLAAKIVMNTIKILTGIHKILLFPIFILCLIIA